MTGWRSHFSFLQASGRTQSVGNRRHSGPAVRATPGSADWQSAVSAGWKPVSLGTDRSFARNRCARGPVFSDFCVEPLCPPGRMPSSTAGQRPAATGPVGRPLSRVTDKLCCYWVNFLPSWGPVNAKRNFLIVVSGLLLATLSWAQSTQLMIQRDSGPARLGVVGEANHNYALEASAGDLSSNGWQPLITATLTNSPFTWLDSASELMPRRFYRAVQLADSASPVVAPDFRLIDHLGRSHELKYHLADTNVRSIVLVFTGNGCGKVQEMIAVIKSLRDQFGPQGVLFWMVDANAADDRSNIVVEANALGIDLPILHDRAQLVAREIGRASCRERV